MRYFQSAKSFCVQNFLVLRPSPANPTSQPTFLNQTQGDSLAQIYETFTDDIVSPPSFLPSIETACLILEQQQQQHSNVTTTDNESSWIINDTLTELWQVDFSCEWTSRFTTVDYLPQRFLDHVTQNLGLLVDVMQEDVFDVSIVEAFPPKAVAIIHNNDGEDDDDTNNNNNNNNNKGATAAPTPTNLDDGDDPINNNPSMASDLTAASSAGSNSDILTAGEISAIVLAVVVGIGIVIVLALHWKKKKRKMSATTPNNSDDSNGENQDSKEQHSPSHVVVDNV